MKAKQCRLILHGSCMQLDWGIFESIAAAKKYVSECWDKPYTIEVINSKKNSKK